MFIYCWSKEYTSIEFCRTELGISSDETVVDWNNYLREVCAQSLLANPISVGGPGLTVEVDESLFVRRKFNVGRLRREQWVVGGVCRETNECFLYAVDNRNAETLTGVITSSIRPGSTIVTDCWRGYLNIESIPNMSYTHLTVNHQQNFVDPTTGAHTNTVEGMWSMAKQRAKRRNGLHKSFVDSYLCEFMYRRRHSNVFSSILQDIATLHPL